MVYDPTAGSNNGVLLTEGEHVFTVERGIHTQASTGRDGWKFTLKTVQDGVEVRRTYRLWLGVPEMTDQNIARLIDAVGGDPAKPEVMQKITTLAINPEHFVGKELAATIYHKQHEGRTVDEIGDIIPKTYRKQWDAAQAQRQSANTANPRSTAAAGNGDSPAASDDSVPF